MLGGLNKKQKLWTNTHPISLSKLRISTEVCKHSLCKYSLFRNNYLRKLSEENRNLIFDVIYNNFLNMFSNRMPKNRKHIQFYHFLMQINIFSNFFYCYFLKICDMVNFAKKIFQITWVVFIIHKIFRNKCIFFFINCFYGNWFFNFLPIVIDFHILKLDYW